VREAKRAGGPRRRWRCPCRAIRGFLGTVFGQLAAALVGLSGVLVAVVLAATAAPERAALLAALALALAVALLAGWLLTRPLRALQAAVAQLREGGYGRPLAAPSLPGPASAEVAAIERACRELAERVAREARASGQAEARAQALLARTSRELQGPLVAVQSELRRLSGREGPLSDHARQAALAAALEGTEHALRLAGEADALARLLAPEVRVRPEPFALEVLARGIVQRLRPQAGRLGVDLDVGAPAGLPLVVADHDLVSEGLGRLVDHTVRHCPVGARVRVTLQGQGDRVRALVRGIEVDLPSSSLAQGLPPVSGAGAPAADGLALAIVKRVVELHGGELEVSAMPGLQASYAFTLPGAAAVD
jgi:signal transduction histidine kinase